MRIKWLLLISILLAGYASYGQLRRVMGQVTDATDGKPLVQLSVLLKGAAVGVVTDADGRYSIEVPGPDAVLQFLYMGMESQEVEVGERTEINISMRPSTEAIEQVVVMGYGSGKKVSSTVGRVSSVAARSVQAHPTASALDGIAGRVPGLSVLSYTGEPSEAGSIRLHGAGSLGASSAPLIVVDGLPVSTETLLSINPQDFERVDILTDASATSIYGSRAANGVIYVTTKQGQEGEKASVMARYSFGLSNLASTRYY
ncbi:MAG: TonB-dependent receptor plug domain-containing protein, partial [Bacteroidia bacterium]|nr:TonB-dependent receptor plug domain-containing protein [Bacteroidia bacterium]